MSHDIFVSMVQLNSQASSMSIGRHHRTSIKMIVWKKEFEIQNPLETIIERSRGRDLLRNGRVVLEARLYY